MSSPKSVYYYQFEILLNKLSLIRDLLYNVIFMRQPFAQKTPQAEFYTHEILEFDSHLPQHTPRKILSSDILQLSVCLQRLGKTSKVDHFSAIYRCIGIGILK